MALVLDLILIGLNIVGVTYQSARSELLEVRKIWDKAPHSAFTDLAFFEGRWYCTFRAAKSHASYGDDGNKYLDKIDFIFSTVSTNDHFHISDEMIPSFICPPFYPLILHKTPKNLNEIQPWGILG